MVINELEQILLHKYKTMDNFHGLNKNSYEIYSKRWDWWNHPKNCEFVISVIGTIASERIYYNKVPRYLNETKNWFKYLKNNPNYQDIFAQTSYSQIFDYLCKCDSQTFLSMYNDFNQNMGNPDKNSRDEWIFQHNNYLPKTTHGFNKKEVVLDYNWRLSHQGNLSKYWGFVRPDLKSSIRASWLNNRRDVGRSCKYEAIITKKLLYDLLDNLPPLYQIICLFLAQTGLRISDAIRCLLNQWDDIQYISYSGKGRYYIPDVNTMKRKNSIYFVFISEELMLLLNYYVPNKEYQNKVRYLIEKTISYDPNIHDQIDFLRSEFNKHLKKSFRKIRHKYFHIKPYQSIKPHLLRKYFITQTDRVKNKLGDNYLLYIAGHKPLDPLYITYNQSLRIVRTNLKRFIEFIEPSVEIGFSQKKIELLSKKKSEINKIFYLNFKKFLKEKVGKDYFSLINISEFFLKRNFSISSDDIVQLISEMVQQDFIQKFGSYFSFNSEPKINEIEKSKIFRLKQLISKRENKEMSFSELCNILNEDNGAKSSKDLFILIKRLSEINILSKIEDMFYIN